MQEIDYSPVFGIPAKVENGIIEVAKKVDLDKVILFGSRATGKAWQRSDIDLAASFKDARQFFDFKDELEELPTLLIFDVVDLNSSCVSLDVKKSIEDEGIVIYEKV